MSLTEKDEYGNTILDDWGQPIQTEKGRKLERYMYIGFAMLVLFIFAGVYYDNNFAVHDCHGCGNPIKEGVGLDQYGVLVDGGAWYHSNNCWILSQQRELQKETDEYLKLVKKHNKLNKGY